MKAALLESIGKLMITEVERPVLADPDQVLVQVKAVGVCGSEIHGHYVTPGFESLVLGGFLFGRYGIGELDLGRSGFGHRRLLYGPFFSVNILNATGKYSKTGNAF